MRILITAGPTREPLDPVRYLSNRSTIDTTWSAKYKYEPLDNPLVDLEVKYSHSNTDHTDKRDAQA